MCSLTLDDKLKVTSYTKSFVEDILPEKYAMGYNILSVFDASEREDIQNIFEACKVENIGYTLSGKKTLATSSSSNNFPVRILIPAVTGGCWVNMAS